MDVPSEDLPTTTVTGAGGVPIAVRTGGDGPSLVAVHGGMCDGRWWDPVRARLEADRTISTPDRRDHGASGHSSGPYALADEAQDLLAVLAATPAPVDLVGHSYGGLVALEAALRGAPLRAMVLYEPSIGDDDAMDGLLDRIEALVAEGEVDEAVGLLLTERMGMSPHRLAAAKVRPGWKQTAAHIGTLPRQGRTAAGYVMDREALAALAVPTLVMVGDMSPAWRLEACRELAGLLPAGRLEVMERHGHLGPVDDPDGFAATVMDFLDAPAGA
ncbi:alpha/beta fold hydrolase [Baekduia soli]|uniref:Alpha/beta fold hydrolase n=1 Tax=Baekduia soli TaxID=496014 RepID=A0A5B8U0N1_9ACTN|nr:alpha/beta hydrolase [Baekduia soli]QEC46541.1 alpha/beta fold hydrolase [Baekduia soli]